MTKIQKHLSRLKIVLLQNQKGGIGKSTIAEAAVAGFEAGGQRTALVDVDDGNSGSIRRSGKGSAIVLPWDVDPRSLTRWADQHLQDIDVLVIDCGANMVASGAPVNEFLGELVTAAYEAGGQTYLFAIAPTNAPGTGRLVNEMIGAYGELAKIVVIQNNQDGSGNFSKSLDIVGRKKATFPHIDAGIQAARLLKVAPLLDVLTAPPENYNIAMANLAGHVADFIGDTAVADLFGPEAISAVRALATGASGSLGFRVSRLAEATDVALVANAACQIAAINLRDIVDKHRDDHGAIARCAIKLHDARKALAAIVRAA